MGYISEDILTTIDGKVMLNGDFPTMDRVIINTNTVQGQLEAFRKSYTIQSAVSKRIGAIKNMRVWAQDINGKKVVNDIVRSDLDKMEHLNPYQDFNTFNSAVETQCLVHGICYIYKKKKAIGFDDFDNYIIPNEIIAPINLNRNYNELFELVPDYYNVTISGKVLKLEVSEITIIRDNWIRNFTGGWGLSRINALKEPIITLLSGTNALSTLYSEGGMRGIISLGANNREGFTSNLLNKDRGELQQELKKYGTLRDQFHYIVTRSAMDYVPITSKIVDMQLPDNLKVAETAIYGGFGVPNAFLEMETRYKALPEARKEFISGTIIPEISSRYDTLVELRGIPKRAWRYYPDWSGMDIYQDVLNASATGLLNAMTALEKAKNSGLFNNDELKGMVEPYLDR